MKKNFFHSLAAAAVMAAAFVSCSSDDILNTSEPENARTITVNLIPESQTRTMLDADAKLHWQSGDEVSYFTSTNGTDWSTSTKAEINASTGSFTASIPTGATQIRVVYPAVDNGTDFSADLYAVKKYQNYAVKELADGEFFFDGKYLPMYTEPTAIPTGEEMNASYKVNGAVVKLHINYPLNSDNIMHIKGVRLGNYQFGFPKGMYRITNETSCDVCVVLPIDQAIKYRPFVTAQRETYSWGKWVYYNNTYSYPSDKTTTFSPKAYTLNFDLTTATKPNTFRNWAICFGDETNNIPTDQADNYFNVNNGTLSSGASFSSYTYNDSWYLLSFNSGSKATYKIHNTQNTAYKIDLVFIGYDAGRFKTTLKTDTEIVDESYVVTPGSNSFTTDYTYSYYLLKKLPVGDYTFEVECESPGANIFGYKFQAIEPAFTDIPIATEIWPSEINYRANCKVAGGIGTQDERFIDLTKYSKISIHIHNSQSRNYTVSFNAATSSNDIVATATVFDAESYQTVGTPHNVNITNNGTSLSEYSFNTGELAPGNYFLVFTFNGDVSQFRHIQIKDNVADLVDNGDGTGTLNGHAWVDLGLTSSDGKRLVFATCNIGAADDTEYGNRYSWGEVDTKDSYVQSNYTLYKDKRELVDEGVIDANGILTPEHDAATVNWGEGWRMPTKEDFETLISNTNKTWSGNGTTLTSKTNSKSINLKKNTDGYSMYWCSTKTDTGKRVWLYTAYSSANYVQNVDDGIGGFAIRPVAVID